MGKNFVRVGLDMGSSKTRVVVGEFENGNMSVTGVGTVDSRGVKNGEIVHDHDVIKNIKDAVKKAEKVSGLSPIRGTWVGIAGNLVEMMVIRTVVAIAHEEQDITEEDVIRCLESSKSICVRPGWTVVDTYPVQFYIDGMNAGLNPKGRMGIRLEADVCVTIAPDSLLRHMAQTVNQAGLQVEGFCLSPFAVGESLLTPQERKKECVVVDIGKSSTKISFFEKGVLVAIRTLPVGGEYIAHDLAYAFGTSHAEAQRLQEEYGYVDGDQDEAVYKARRTDGTEFDVTQGEISQVIGARVEEMLAMVRSEVLQMGIEEEEQIPYLLAGGVSELQGMESLAKDVLGNLVRLGEPPCIGAQNPSLAGGVGIVKMASYRLETTDMKEETKEEKETLVSPPQQIKKEKEPVIKKEKVKEKKPVLVSKPKPMVTVPKVKEKMKESQVLEKVKSWFSEFI